MSPIKKPWIILWITVWLWGGCKNAPHNKDVSPSKATIDVPSIKKIAIMPYQGFDTSWIMPLRQSIQAFYRLPVEVLPMQAIPVAAWYAPRQRYKADSLLVFQHGMATSGGTIVGLLHHDISTRNNDNPDWGVFGLGYCPGSACVISTWRLKRASSSKQQSQERLTKVVLHELGHNLGIPHCTSDQPTCLMNDAKGTMAQVDNEQLRLCGQCKQRIKR